MEEVSGTGLQLIRESKKRGLKQAPSFLLEKFNILGHVKMECIIPLFQ